MGTALDSFRDDIRRIDEFSDRATVVATKFDTDAKSRDDEASEFRRKAADSSLSQDDRDAAKSEAGERKAEAKQARADIAEWERDIERVWVLRLVTAFEVFLRQLVIEKASGNPTHVRDFLAARYGLELGMPLHLGRSADASERIANCVDTTRLTFSSLDDTSNYFKDWLGGGFAGNECAPPLNTVGDKKAARADVRILLQMRHILVHKSGIPNPNYHRVLTSDDCRGRLDASVRNLSRTPPLALPPDAVLSSKAIDPSNPSKKEELYQSLLNFAEHVDALYP